VLLFIERANVHDFVFVVDLYDLYDLFTTYMKHRKCLKRILSKTFKNNIIYYIIYVHIFFMETELFSFLLNILNQKFIVLIYIGSKIYFKY